MSCFISQNFVLDCRNASIGGVKQLWILGASGNTITSYTVDADEKITAMSGSGVWYSFALPKQSASFTEELSVNDAAQSISFNPSLNISLPKLDQSLRNTFFELTKQNEIYAIMLDNNERYWMLFLANGGTISAGNMQTGQNYNDLNGVTVTLSGGEPNPSREFDLGVGTLSDLLTAGGFTVE